MASTRKSVMTAMLLIGGSVSVGAAAQSEHSGFASQSCPGDFFGLPLYPDAKMCQLFSDGLPASLTYHASTDQTSAQQFFTKNLGDANKTSTLLGRTVMEYDSSNVIIVISKDGDGTQVDVLVKSDIQSPFPTPSTTVEAEAEIESEAPAEDVFFEPEREVLVHKVPDDEKSLEPAPAEEPETSSITEGEEASEQEVLSAVTEREEVEPAQMLESEPEAIAHNTVENIGETPQSLNEAEPMPSTVEAEVAPVEEIAEVEEVTEEIVTDSESNLAASELELNETLENEASQVEQSIAAIASSETTDITAQQTAQQNSEQDEPPMDGDYPVEDF